MISDHNVNLLREMGGVMFVYSLFKSNVVHPSVRQTALFTLGTLAEANGTYCVFNAKQLTVAYW